MVTHECGVYCVKGMVDLKRRRRDTTSASYETKLTQHEALLEVLLPPNPRIEETPTMSNKLGKLIYEPANIWDMHCSINPT